MSQSPVTVTYSLEQVLTRIEGKIDKLDQKIDQKTEELTRKIDNMQESINDLKVGQAKLGEKVDGLSKRLEFQEFINRGIFIGLVLAVVGGAARLFGWVGNP